MEKAETAGEYQESEVQTAYIFNPLDDEKVADRPSKRRKVGKRQASGKAAAANTAGEGPGFVPLLNGTENEASVRQREQLFEESWAPVGLRIQRVLREANQTTLGRVDAFVRETADLTSKIPSAFIITGPNSSPQDLLFEQLAESLRDACQGRFVRMRSAEAPNLKATLKKVIRDASLPISGGGDGAEGPTRQDGRKYLDYDLDALYASLKPNESRRVILALEDAEAFDSSLLCDLIALLSEQQDRIRFTLIFGIATSVDLFQARLLKSTCQQLYGGQFDVVQTAAILDSVVKCAVASADIHLRIGSSLLRSIVERQREQMASVQMLVNSLKYAHACHFYANLLSVFLSPTDQWNNGLVQSEHLEAVRSTPSFRAHVEASLEEQESTAPHIRRLILDDAYLLLEMKTQTQRKIEWARRLLRSLQLITAGKLSTESFTDLYVAAFAEGIDASGEASVYGDAIRSMTPEALIGFVQRLLDAIKEGDADLGLANWDGDVEDLCQVLSAAKEQVDALRKQVQKKGGVLRSKYTAQSKVLRTTVIAQKVQLSHDSAALTGEDKALTEAVDKIVQHVCGAIHCDSVESLLFQEVWLYDSRTPYKDVFVPRPGAVVGRALSRPHDYLACSCCGQADGGNASTLPATSILYHLYLEAGALINVADLWSAFFALVGGDDGEAGLDERTGLVLFYRALAELKAMGFVKASRKKADHIAKVKWL